MPIRRSGYVGDTHRKERAKLYNSKSWRHVRALVKARAGGRCEWCRKQGVDAVHLTGTTLDAIRSGDGAERERDCAWVPLLSLRGSRRA